MAENTANVQWESIWDTISRMQELQELRFFAKILFLDHESPRISTMQPLMNRVKGLKVYELGVPNDQLRLWQGLVNGNMGSYACGLAEENVEECF